MADTTGNLRLQNLLGLIPQESASAPVTFNPNYYDSEASESDTFGTLPRNDNGTLLRNDGNEPGMPPQYQFEALFTKNSGQESTMEWHMRNLYCHYLCLRYACVMFRYHLLTSVPYYTILHDAYSPQRRRRTYAEICWERARRYVIDRYNIALEIFWVDLKGSQQIIDQNILFETVSLHINLPGKYISSRTYYRLKGRNIAPIMHG